LPVDPYKIDSIANVNSNSCFKRLNSFSRGSNREVRERERAKPLQMSSFEFRKASRVKRAEIVDFVTVHGREWGVFFCGHLFHPSRQWLIQI
jgi:hypothetical protein